ncbi:MAG: tetratricopeptide repeat protein [Candidatus Thorarchaeota archaeon]
MSKGEDLPIETVKEGVRLYEEGVMHEANSDSIEAIACYEKMMRLTFPDPPVLNRIAYCHLMLNETAKAKDSLRQSIEIDPYNEEALHNLSLLLIDEGKLDAAEGLTRRGMALETMLDKHWYNLGRIQFRKSQFKSAVISLATSLGLAPDRADAHHTIAMAYYHLGELEQAERSFLRGVELAPDDVEMLMSYGNFLLVQKKNKDAEKYFRLAVDQAPIDHEALTSLAQSLIEQMMGKKDVPDEKIEETMMLLNKSLDLHVAHGQTWYQWARVRMLFNDWKEAEDFLRTAIDNGCREPMAWAYLSAVIDRQGRKKEAEEAFEEYKKIAGIEEEDSE